MKIVKSSVEILPQEKGVEGMYKLIERVGRTSYQSLDKITDDSYKKFLKMLYDRGHWAVFNLGAVYLSVPVDKYSEELNILGTKPYSSYTRWATKDDNYLITTNYRVICQTGLQKEMEKFWCDPTEEHYHRVCTSWICSRSIQQEVTRHRIFSFLIASTRYINYSKSRFGGELTFILPQWVYRVRDEIADTVDSLTGEKRDYLKNLDGEELWKALCCLDRTVASRDNFYRAAEEEYMYELSTDEGEKLKPEEARDCLPLGFGNEMCMAGFVSDFTLIPDKNTPEKAGFFYLRSASDAHSDIRVLSDNLKEQFKEQGIYNLK